MSIGRTIVGLWRSREETREHHRDPNLRTRYYREPRDRMVEKVVEVIRGQLRGWHVVHVSRDHGEIVVERRHWLGTRDITITVYHVSPMRSAVDIVSSKRGSFGDLGASYADILAFFQALNRVAQLEQKS
ncbi:hypothetical protein GCM10010885_22830 [Alicyclobacillus cellulosilyticus]|uniref:DUF1499 domain-containing protein n=1 Tax=Alicyclobacillus cellulosilyticus TaxID=1003997 RepID=A0A917KG41_9BACL|nr:hypothetical protein [Alicyclobacillus cellulosilyticus]GGJ12962.1 hypothetical protein GCM10010885_22830 [Alicyclobacillus cellulosilyticus]